MTILQGAARLTDVDRQLTVLLRPERVGRGLVVFNFKYKIFKQYLGF